MKLVRDTLLIFRRYATQSLRSPVWLIMGAVQPVYYLVLFGPLLKSALHGQAARNSYGYFVPGILVMLSVFVTSFVGMALLAELRAGVIERWRVTPVSRLALLLGRALRDIVALMAQCTILVLLALPFGLSADVGGVAVAYLLVALVGLMIASLSYAMALKLHREDAMGSVINFVAQPVVLLSGILLPIAFGPLWLRGLAKVDPLSWVVNAARACFAGHIGDSSVWQALVIVGVLAAISVTLAARAFARAVR